MDDFTKIWKDYLDSIEKMALEKPLKFEYDANTKSPFEPLLKETLESIEQITNLDNLENIRLHHLGKKGDVMLLMRELGKLPNEFRPIVAPPLIKLRAALEHAIQQKTFALKQAKQNEELKTQWLDVSLAGRPIRTGAIHPVSQVIDEVITIFAALGFDVAEGPQIETDYYNFDALNIAPDHPARAEHDTFYLHNTATRAPHVLRTHTSPVQIRHLEKHGAPARIICPGRVYRADYDQTHTPMFHQYEGLCVDKGISMSHLKWVLMEFCKTFFEIDALELRFRASHFPFTEPSAEVDIRCSWQDGKLNLGTGDDWMEILGSGMVHPKVLRAGGIDTDIYQGFAFGMGIDRLAMLKYGIPDLRAFFDSDLRWLRHYGFAALDMPALHQR